MIAFFNRMAVLAVALVFLAGCGDEYVLEVTKTSTNTWTIYDPDSSPDRYLDRTCQTEGKVVANITAPGEAYEWLYVTCADSVQPEPTPEPTATPESEEFIP